MGKHFNVAPRYSAGSPAMVDEATAHRVANDERGAYQHAIEGRYGPELAQIANTLGLKGIVEERMESARGWKVLDLITGDYFLRLFNAPDMTCACGAKVKCYYKTKKTIEIKEHQYPQMNTPCPRGTLRARDIERKIE